MGVLDRYPAIGGVVLGAGAAFGALTLGMRYFFVLPPLAMALAFVLSNRSFAQKSPLKVLMIVLGSAGAIALGTYIMLAFNLEEISEEAFLKYDLPRMGKFLFEAGIAGLVTGALLFISVSMAYRNAPSNYLTQGIFAVTAAILLLFFVLYQVNKGGDWAPGLSQVILVAGFGLWQGIANHLMTRIVSGW